jgi:hypothetical protein
MNTLIFSIHELLKAQPSTAERVEVIASCCKKSADLKHNPKIFSRQAFSKYAYAINVFVPKSITSPNADKVCRRMFILFSKLDITLFGYITRDNEFDKITLYFVEASRDIAINGVYSAVQSRVKKMYTGLDCVAQVHECEPWSNSTVKALKEFSKDHGDSFYKKATRKKLEHTIKVNKSSSLIGDESSRSFKDEFDAIKYKYSILIYEHRKTKPHEPKLIDNDDEINQKILAYHAQNIDTWQTKLDSLKAEAKIEANEVKKKYE